jgi:hypothetical protein
MDATVERLRTGFETCSRHGVDELGWVRSMVRIRGGLEHGPAVSSTRQQGDRRRPTGRAQAAAASRERAGGGGFPSERVQRR